MQGSGKIYKVLWSDRKVFHVLSTNRLQKWFRESVPSFIHAGLKPGMWEDEDW